MIPARHIPTARHRRGFGFLDLLVWLTGLAIIGALLVHFVSTTTVCEIPYEKVARTKMQSIAFQVDMYETLVKQRLVHLGQLAEPPGGHRPFIKHKALRDPWNTPWNYERQGKSFVLSSAGEDRRHGTRDDIIYEADPTK